MLTRNFGVKVGKRFVHQKHGGSADDGTGKGHALALASRKLTGAVDKILRMNTYATYLYCN